MAKRNSYAIEVGMRLKNIIDIYFENQKAFAEKVGINENTISNYVNGKNLLSNKTAVKFQKTVSVNKDYLFNGNHPLVIDDAIKPIKDAAKSMSNKLKSEREDLYAKEGNIRYNVMRRSGFNSTINSQKEVSIIGLTINGINTKDAQATEIKDKVFINTYKNLFHIADDCVIITSDIWEDGEGVLLKHNKEHRIALLDDGKYYDAITKETIEVSDENIVGKIYKILNVFEVSW
jgi:plasmid maintenance system antidote protein VapI